MRNNDLNNQKARRWGAARLILMFIMGLMGGILLCLAAVSGLDQIRPSIPLPKSMQSTPLPVSSPMGKLDLNLATRTELEQLPGVGPVLAEAILNFRRENGRFHFIEELMDVPGIGEKKFLNIRDLVFCSPAEGP